MAIVMPVWVPYFGNLSHSHKLTELITGPKDLAWQCLGCPKAYYSLSLQILPW